MNRQKQSFKNNFRKGNNNKKKVIVNKELKHADIKMLHVTMSGDKANSSCSSPRESKVAHPVFPVQVANFPFMSSVFILRIASTSAAINSML